MTEDKQTQAKKAAIALIVHTSRRSYAVWHRDITAIRSCSSEAEVAAWGTAERPGLAVDLGELLESAAPILPQRASALIITMRRRPIAFIVKHVEEMVENPQIQPLPAIMRTAMQQQWATGVLYDKGELHIVLDLRELARSVLVGHRA